jgi:hypothetical protein
LISFQLPYQLWCLIWGQRETGSSFSLTRSTVSLTSLNATSLLQRTRACPVHAPFPCPPHSYLSTEIWHRQSILFLSLLLSDFETFASIQPFVCSLIASPIAKVSKLNSRLCHPSPNY